MRIRRVAGAVLAATVVVCAYANVLAGWSSPELISELNASATERAAYPCLSRDGLTMYFSRVDPGSGRWRIMEAYRDTPDGVFTSERVLSELVATGYNLVDPWVSADELRLYYVEFEASGASKAKMAQRAGKGDAWMPVRVFTELHTNNADLERPSLTEDELIVVFSSIRPGSAGSYDLWMASRAARDGVFGNIRPLYEINFSGSDRRPCIMPDGLTLYFTSSDRGGDVSDNIYRVTRNSRIGTFEGLERVSLPAPLPDKRPIIVYTVPDEKAVYFTIGGGNIYVTHWLEVTGVFHVDAIKGSDLNDGSSKDMAFKTIQAGVDVAADGSTVLVWPGVYNEQVNFRGKAITVQSAGDAAVVRAASGYAFSFHSGEGTGSVLKNFVIRDCEYGIYLTNGASPTLGNLTIVNNKYGVSAFDGSNPRITNCILWGNTHGDLFDCQASYSCVQGGDAGEGNVSSYPLFADERATDFHLKSERGRYVAPDAKLPPFDAPVNLPELNDGIHNAFGPYLSVDGLTMYIARYVPEFGHVCLLEAYREHADGPFTRQRTIGELARGHDCSVPWVSQDGLRLYYREAETSGTPRIKMAQRNSTADMWTWVRTFDELHVSGVDAAKPSLTADELIIFFHSTRAGGAGQSDLWTASRSSMEEPFGNIRPLYELNTSSHDTVPFVLANGLTLYFSSTDRPGHPGIRLYKAERAGQYESFRSPELVEVSNSSLQAGMPFVSADEKIIYFVNGTVDGIYVMRAREGQWVLDGITSPCIDAGDPGVDPSGEGMPNGGRINMGAYGGTASASMSEWPVASDINRDGVVNISDLSMLASDWLNALPWAQ